MISLVCILLEHALCETFAEAALGDQSGVQIPEGALVEVQLLLEQLLPKLLVQNLVLQEPFEFAASRVKVSTRVASVDELQPHRPRHR